MNSAAGDMAINGHLIRVGYVSRARFPLGEASDQDILIVSRDRNAACRVTGFLFRTTRHFIQILEGHETDVLNTMTRIRRDNRHSDIREWPPEWVEQRIFADWDMGYCATAEDDRFAFALSWKPGEPPTQTVLKLKAMSETFA